MYLPVKSGNFHYVPLSTAKRVKLEIVLSLIGHVGSNPTISANKRHQLRLVPFLRLDGADENRAAVRRPQAISPAGCCLARGRISTISANKRHQLRLVPFLRLDGTDENRAAARRPQAISPAGCCLARGRISTISARSRRLHFETGGNILILDRFQYYSNSTF